MDFRDKDGEPAAQVDDAGGGVRGLAGVHPGPPCDYSGISYDDLRRATGIQWPCTEEHPDGCERLYADGRFPTSPDYCETFGHDLVTGATVGEEAYRAHDPERPRDPQGRAVQPAARAAGRRVPVLAHHRAGPSTTSTPGPRPAAVRS